VLAVGSGVALALAMPGPGLPVLLLLFPGLMLEALERTPAGWRTWLFGWLAGTVHWMVATNWVMPVMHHYGGLPVGAAVIALFGMGALLGICWAFATGLTALVPVSYRVWLFPCVWIAIDAWRQFWPYRFSWNPPAAAFADTPEMLGSLSVWGATGLGWAAIMLGAGLWAVLRRETRRTGLAAIGVPLALTLLFGFMAPRARFDGPPIRVAAIQPGTSLEEKWDPANWREMEERVWRLTSEASSIGAELVLWPESAMPYRVESDPAFRQVLVDAARELAADIVLNSVGGSEEEGYTNSAFVVRPSGVASVRYDKVRLVPFGEFVPWWARLGFATSLVREVGSFTPGDEPRILEARVPLGMAICYEVIFADQMAKEVRSGAQLLITLTNDGWYGYSWAPRQHFAQVILRSVENRRWFARAALTGITGFVDPTGHVRAKLDVGETGVLVEEIQPASGLTPRARWGDWWCVVSALTAIALLAAGIAGKRPSAEALER